jgi:FtsH-binding integral membrane protein
MSIMADPRMQTQTRSGAVSVGAYDEGLRSYMLRVYNYMALGVAFTAIVTLLVASNPALMQAIALGPMKWVLFIGVLALGFFSPRLIFSGNSLLAHGAYWLYAAMWGALISPMIFYFMQTAQGQGDIARAFFITAATFGAMSLYGYTTKRNLSAFATFFFMASIGLLIAIVVNAIFFASTMMSLITSGLVVLLFSGVTAYETQMIKNMYAENDSASLATGKAIFGAFALYGSFVVLFVHILNILGIMRSE